MMDLDQPVAPTTLAEAGLSLDLVNQLVLKTLYFAGELSGADLSRRLGLQFSVIEATLDFLKVQRHSEIVGSSAVGGASYRYRLMTEGRAAAMHCLQQSQYVGVAPVPLAQYQRRMRDRRAGTRFGVTRDQVRKGLSHLVLKTEVLDEIGPALNGGRSVFIYGPPGNGKTMIAHALRDLLSGDIQIPHAIEVDGSIIRVFDPVYHEELPSLKNSDSSLDLATNTDQRWATCRRPMVSAGGELTLEALDLSFHPRAGYYRAPLQLVANGGMLLIDDFGRQRCSPQDLLNRWMVPLEDGKDYLMLESGLTFEVPFHVFVAFSTNLKPSELVDEAFLRRVRYKVFAESPSVEEFIQIFDKCCQARKVPFDPAVVEQLLNGYFREHNIERRGCHPRDLVTHALLLAEYRGESAELSLPLLESACKAYFVVNEGLKQPN